MARPSKLLQHVEVEAPDGGKEVVSMTEAICRLVKLGVWPGNAAAAHGVTRTTLNNWRNRGGDYGEDPDLERIAAEAPDDLPYVEFLAALTRAEAQGLAWHEVNVRKAAQSGKEQGGRLSLEFLSRRQPSVYSRRLEIDDKPKDRGPAPLDAPLVGEVEETFDATFLPEGIDAASLLPELTP